MGGNSYGVSGIKIASDGYAYPKDTTTAGITLTSEFSGNAIEKGTERYYYLGKGGEFKGDDGEDIGGEISCKLKIPDCGDFYAYVDGSLIDLSEYSITEFGLKDGLSGSTVYSQTDLSNQGYDVVEGEYFVKYVLNQEQIYDSTKAELNDIFGKDVSCYVKLKNPNTQDEKVIKSDTAVLIPRNLKDHDLLEDIEKAAFIVSSDDWREALNLISGVTMFKGINSDIDKNIYDNDVINENCLDVAIRTVVTPQDVAKCAYPLLVYDSSRLLDDSVSEATTLVNKALRPVGDEYGGVFVTSSDFLSKLYMPETLVFLGGVEPKLNKKVNAEIRIIGSSNDLWKTQGVKVVVPYDDPIAHTLESEVATEFEAPVVFTDDPQFHDKIENKLIIYISSTDSTSDENIGNIAEIKNNGGILLVSQYESASDKFVFSTDTSPNSEPTFPTGTTRPYAGIQDYIYHKTKPDTMVLVNPNSLKNEFESSDWHNKDALIASIIAGMSDKWTVGPIDEETPWTDYYREYHVNSGENDITPPSEVYDTAERVKGKIQTVDTYFKASVNGNFPGNPPRDPTYFMFGSPISLPAWIQVIIYGDCTEPELLERMKIWNIPGIKIETRIFSNNIYATSSIVAQILFPRAPKCPDITKDTTFEDPDFPEPGILVKKLPPYIQFLIGSKNALLTPERIKHFSESDYKYKNLFKKAVDFETFILSFPTEGLEGFEGAISCYVDQNIVYETLDIPYGTPYGAGYIYDQNKIHILSETEKKFMIADYINNMNLERAMRVLDENIVGMVRMAFTNECEEMEFPDDDVYKLLGPGFKEAIQDLFRLCASSESQLPPSRLLGRQFQTDTFDTMVSDIYKLLDYQNQLLGNATELRDYVNAYVENNNFTKELRVATSGVGGSTSRPNTYYWLTEEEALIGPISDGYKEHVQRKYAIWNFWNSQVNVILARRDESIKKMYEDFPVTQGPIFQKHVLGREQAAFRDGTIISPAPAGTPIGAPFSYLYSEAEELEYGEFQDTLYYPGGRVDRTDRAQPGIQWSVSGGSWPDMDFIDKRANTYLFKKLGTSEECGHLDVCTVLPDEDVLRPILPFCATGPDRDACYPSNLVEIRANPKSIVLVAEETLVEEMIKRQFRSNIEASQELFKKAESAILCIHNRTGTGPSEMYQHCAIEGILFKSATLSQVLSLNPPVRGFSDVMMKHISESGNKVSLDNGNLDLDELEGLQKIDAMRAIVADNYFDLVDQTYTAQIDQVARENSHKMIAIGIGTAIVSIGLPVVGAAVGAAATLGSTIATYTALFLLDMSAIGANYYYGSTECEKQIVQMDRRLSIKPSEKKGNTGPNAIGNYRGCKDLVIGETAVFAAAAVVINAVPILYFKNIPRTSTAVNYLRDADGVITTTFDDLDNFVVGPQSRSFIENAEANKRLLKEMADLGDQTSYGGIVAAKQSIDDVMRQGKHLGDEAARIAKEGLESLTPPINCFIAGTLITMSDGTQKPIEDVVVGDRVVSYDFETERLINSTVEKLIQPVHSDMINITFSSGKSNVNTFDHPYWVEEKGWSSYKPDLTLERYAFEEVSQLEVGDKVLVLDGNELVGSVVLGIREDIGEVQTYIFELKNEKPHKIIIEYEIID
ncbi:MAG: hypothetical protein ABH840_02575 [Nanoarchaeota archaeon]